MARIVAKFGGTSVGDIERIERVADKIKREVERGNEVAVVVSAMSGVTNQLVGYCEAVSPTFDDREYDTVVSSGEQVTSGLLALALHKRGIAARSWQGWQLPIYTSEAHGRARIERIETAEMEKGFKERGEVAVLAGFQGVSFAERIATLGRGGSDTTAVALAAALNADRCDIYTDVDGIYTTDPRVAPKAKRLSKVSYEEMLEMASTGAKVMQTRSVEMAFKRQVPVQVLSSFNEDIGSDMPGTLITKEEEIMEQYVVNGITFTRNDAKVTLQNVPDTPGIAADVFGPLTEANINVDMIVQNVSPDGKTTDMTFTVPRSDLNKTVDALKGAGLSDNIKTADNVSKVSVVGIGMVSHAGVAQTMFQTLADKGINIQVISTSEIKISVLIDEEYTELAVRALHTAYGLDAEDAA